MRSVIRFSVAIAALVLAAASADRQSTYSPSTDKHYPPLAPTCPIAIFSTPPQRAYEELGTYDFTYQASSPEQVLRSLGDVKRAIGPDACRLGGNAIIGFSANGSVYNRATVIRWTEQDTPAAPAAAAPVGAPAPGPNQTVPAPPPTAAAAPAPGTAPAAPATQP